MTSVSINNSCSLPTQNLEFDNTALVDTATATNSNTTTPSNTASCSSVSLSPVNFYHSMTALPSSKISDISTEACNTSEVTVKNELVNPSSNILVNSSSNNSQDVATGPTGDSVVKVAVSGSGEIPTEMQPKRLHVSNIPFRFRDPDLRAMFGVSNFCMLTFLSNDIFLIILLKF